MSSSASSMGCGASQPYKAPTAADEDDQDDPKLREYLKMRGLDPVDMQNRAPPPFCE